MKTYTSYLNDIPRIINNSASDNLLWGMEQLNDATRYLVTKYYFNERSYTTTTVSGTQFYNLPPQVKKLINVTVSIGGVLWQPKECPSRQMWDSLNVVSFNQDYPSYFFVYNGQVGIFPKPSSNGNTITMNYKTRIEDLTMADVTDVTSTKTLAITTNTTTVTASGSAFAAWMAGNWIRVNHNSTDANNGDNQWYQIDSVTSATVLVLKNAYTGSTVVAGTFTVGQVSLLPEDYQDLPLYRMGMVYYSTRLMDTSRFNMYKELYEKGEAKLDEEFGSKTTGIVLEDTGGAMINPNLYQANLTQL